MAGYSGYSEGQQRVNRSWQDLRKVCARFGGGVKWGLGTQFERTCREQDCSNCSGRTIDRQCRFFDFRPHYTVKTVAGAEAKVGPVSPRQSRRLTASLTSGAESRFLCWLQIGFHPSLDICYCQLKLCGYRQCHIPHAEWLQSLLCVVAPL